jgi:hypothetical protein
LELDARTLAYFGTLFTGIGITYGVMKVSLRNIVDELKKLRGNITTLFDKLDRKNRREETRYRKISMALTAIVVAMPAGNPHAANIKGIVDGLASNGDD